MSDLSAIVSRKIRAPQTDGEALLEPAWEQLVQLGRKSAQLPSPWAKLASEARQAILEAAQKYTAPYRDVSFAAGFTATSRLILSGHQPGLFHPGVWLKNFALAELAQQSGSLGINLIVDNDTLRSAELRVPTHFVQTSDAIVPLVSAGQPSGVQSVPFDSASAEVPYEERTIVNPQLFCTLAERVTAILPPLRLPESSAAGTPLVTSLWPEVLAAYQRRTSESKAAPPLGLILAEGRHRLEGKLGLQTLEVPLSVVCQTEPFRRFSLGLLTQLAQFRETYNQLLANYRQANHIRSHAHPFPDLAQEGEWLEAPFWIWQTAAPRRQRLFVRKSPAGLDFTDRQGVSFTVPAWSWGDEPDQAASDQLAAQELAGIKLRPRAIITTLFARLLCSDLFLHGIGGAKYDELTDALISRWLEISPPPYGTLTATLRLPIKRPSTTLAELHDWERRLRDLNFAGERLADQPQSWALLAPAAQLSLQKLAQAKQNLLQQGWPEGTKAAWHQTLSLLNEQMAELLIPVRQHGQKQRLETATSLQQARLLGSREFSFPLFPAETLPRLLLDFCRPRL